VNVCVGLFTQNNVLVGQTTFCAQPIAKMNTVFISESTESFSKITGVEARFSTQSTGLITKTISSLYRLIKERQRITL
jgi:hypothetical protein